MKKDIIGRIAKLFASEDTGTESKFVDVKTDDERIFRVDGDIVAVDATVQEVTADGLVDVEDGDYVLQVDDSTTMTITVASGVITEVVETPAEDTSTDSTDAPAEDAAMGKVFTAVAKFTYSAERFAIIKQISKWEMTVDQEDFQIGTAVTMTHTEDGEEPVTYAAYAGTYELEDGRTITLNDEGVVVLITDAAGIVTDAPAVGDDTNADANAAMEEAMGKVLDAYESLSEKYAKLSQEFEAFKKAPSTKHTDTKIDFKSEDNLNRKRTPLDVMRGK